MFIFLFICTLFDSVKSDETACNSINGAWYNPTKSCYHISINTMSWTESFDYCKNYAAPGTNQLTRLAHILTEEEFTLTINLAQNKQFWIGVRAIIIDSPDVEDWAWVTKDDGNNNELIQMKDHFQPPVVLIYSTGENFLRRYGQEWQDAESTRSNVYGMCQTYIDLCNSVSCNETRQCIPHAGKYDCVCPKDTFEPYCRPALCPNITDCSAPQVCFGGVVEQSGYNCACDTQWNPWSICSGVCDQGLRTRFRYASNCEPQEYEHDDCSLVDACIKDQFEPDNKKASSLMTLSMDFCGSTGLFVGSTCFKLVEADEKIRWDEAFNVCKSQDMSLALHEILYDGDHGFELIISYLLSRQQALNKTVIAWTSLKLVNNELYWMKDSATSMWRFLGDFTHGQSGTKCFTLGPHSTSVNNDVINSQWHQCDDFMPPTNMALCMKNTAYGHFSATKLVRVVDAGSGLTILESHVTFDLYQCGLLCRRNSLCMGFNYDTSNNCQLVTVKLSYPKTVMQRNNFIYVYSEITDVENTFYSRYL